MPAAADDLRLAGYMLSRCRLDCCCRPLVAGIHQLPVWAQARHVCLPGPVVLGPGGRAGGVHQDRSTQVGGEAGAGTLLQLLEHIQKMLSQVDGLAAELFSAENTHTVYITYKCVGTRGACHSHSTEAN